MTVPLLDVEKLSVSFATESWPQRATTVVHGVDFAVAPAEIVALVGESGSGKSTIGRAIARLIPASGQIRLQGVDVLKTSPKQATLAYRRQVQLIFQDPFASLNPVYPIGHPIARALAIHQNLDPAEQQSQVIAALKAVGLEPAAEMAQRYPYALSGGQRQRAAIARALVVDPDLVIADEPTSMLDVSIRMEILRLFQRRRDQAGRSVLLITHDLASARSVADRVVVLYGGRVMEEGPASKVLSKPEHPYTQLLLAASQRGGGLRTPLPMRREETDLKPATNGCPFVGRCLSAVPACQQQQPLRSQLDTATRHHVYCHLKGSH